MNGADTMSKHSTKEVFRVGNGLTDPPIKKIVLHSNTIENLDSELDELVERRNSDGRFRIEYIRIDNSKVYAELNSQKQEMTLAVRHAQDWHPLRSGDIREYDDVVLSRKLRKCIDEHNSEGYGGRRASIGKNVLEHDEKDKIMKAYSKDPKSLH